MSFHEAGAADLVSASLLTKSWETLEQRGPLRAEKQTAQTNRKPERKPDSKGAGQTNLSVSM